MNSVEELRRSLTDHAAGAPGPDGIVEAARAGAVRVRRRRRVLGAAGVAALVVSAIAVASVVRPVRAPVADPPPYRSPVQLTVHLAPDSGFFRLHEGSNGAYQYMIVRPVDPSASPGATVIVADPGTVDPAPFLQGEKLTVDGHPAYFTPNFPVESQGAVISGGTPSTATVSVPALGWPDASGAWLMMFSGGREDLVAVAEAVRLGPPRSMRAAIRLGHLPAGLRYEYAGISGPEENATFAFQATDTPLGRPRLALVAHGPSAPLLNIAIEGASAHRDGETAWIAGLPGATQLRVAGHDAWYATYENLDTPGEDTATLIVRTATCYLRLDAREAARIPLAELTRVVEGAELADCANKATWFDVP
jgi:hypothetical protein